MFSAPYDFAWAAEFLKHIDTHLDRVNKGAAAMIQEHGIELDSMAWQLSTIIPR